MEHNRRTYYPPTFYYFDDEKTPSKEQLGYGFYLQNHELRLNDGETDVTIFDSLQVSAIDRLIKRYMKKGSAQDWSDISDQE